MRFEICYRLHEPDREEQSRELQPLVTRVRVAANVSSSCCPYRPASSLTIVSYLYYRQAMDGQGTQVFCRPLWEKDSFPNSRCNRRLEIQTGPRSRLKAGFATC